MRDIGNNVGRAGRFQGVGGIAQCTGAVGNVVDQDAEAVFYIANDVHNFGHTCFFASLIDDCKRRVVEAFGERAGADNAANIGGYDSDILVAMPLQYVRAHDGRAIKIVGGNIKKALNLPSVQINGQHAVSASFGNQIGNKLGRNGRARAGFPVLTRIAEIGQNGRNAPGRRPA